MPMKNLAAALAFVTCLPGCDALQRRPAADPEANMHSLQASRTALTEGEAETALGIALGVLAEDTGKVGQLLAFWDLCQARNLAWDFADRLRGLSGIERVAALDGQNVTTGALALALLAF